MKIGNMYNLESFQAFCDSGNKKGFTDSYAGAVLARNLTAVDPRVFEKKYPELALVNAGIEADNTGGYSARIQSLRLLDLGGFTNSQDKSADKGKISLAGEDNYLSVYAREANSKWNDDEIKQAELQGINLVSNYISAHNKIYMREVDEIGLIGKAGGPAKGILNTAAFTATSASGAASGLTGQEIYDEIATLITAQWNGVNNTPEYMANRVIMPVSVCNKATTVMLNTAAGSFTVMKALKDNFPSVMFASSFRADDTGSGVSATVAFTNNGEALKMRLPLPLTIGEMIRVGSFECSVDSKYRIGGIDVLESTAGRILTGL